VNQEPLSFRSPLEAYEKQARELIEAYRAGDPEVMQYIREHRPRLPGRSSSSDRNTDRNSDSRSADLALADAQAVVAGAYKFESWPKLVKHVQALSGNKSRVLQFELAVEAIIAGDLAALESLLREDPTLVGARSTREHHATLLHYVSANAVEGYRQKTPKNAADIARFLLAAGAEVDAALAYSATIRKRHPACVGSTTLGLVATSVHPAEAGVQIELLEILLDAGASIDGLSGGWNPLLAALANGRGKAAEFLARRGARLDLEGAAGVGRLDVVERYFDEEGRLKSTATKAQMTSGFAWACEYGHIHVVELLLQRGIDVSARLRHDWQMSLHWAAFGAHVDIVELLLKRNAPVDITENTYNGTPLDWALYGWRDPPPESRRSNYYQVVALLVAAGSTVKREWLDEKSQETALSAKIRADPRMLAALETQRGA
jgi:ankyrin repeat protein